MTNPQSPNQDRRIPFLVQSLHPTTDAKTFAISVEVLSCIHSLHRTNAIARQLNTNYHLPADILYQAIQHLLDATPFSHEQLSSYFHTQQTMEEFHRTLEDTVQASLEVHLPYTVDFLLLGLNLEIYSSLSVHSRGMLHQEYETLFWELLEKDKSVEQFINGAQKLIATMQN